MTVRTPEETWQWLLSIFSAHRCERLKDTCEERFHLGPYTDTELGDLFTS